METKIFCENLERKKKAIGLIHKVYLAHLKNTRKYTASTKTRAEVRGGGRKPWKQKGTGNARAGSSRSPLFEGGGVIFGPRPRIVNKKINKKEKRLALLSALYLKKQQFVFFDVDTFKTFNAIKTKNIKTILSNVGLKETEKTLVILPQANKNIWLASRNLKHVEIAHANSLNIEQLLKSEKILLSKESLDIINSTYGNCYA